MLVVRIRSLAVRSLDLRGGGRRGRGRPCRGCGGALTRRIDATDRGIEEILRPGDEGMPGNLAQHACERAARGRSVPVVTSVVPDASAGATPAGADDGETARGRPAASRSGASAVLVAAVVTAGFFFSRGGSAAGGTCARGVG